MLHRTVLPSLVAIALTGSTACGSAADRRTGIPDLGTMIETVETADPAALRDLVELSQLPCTTEPGEGGPPKCSAGETAGTMVEVFESYDCAVHWRRASEMDELLREVASIHPRRYAVFAAAPGYAPGVWRDPVATLDANYIAVFDTDERSAQRFGTAIAIGREEIVALWLGCGAGEGPDHLIPPEQQEFLLEPPNS